MSTTKSGFTIVELLIVIIVIAILAAITVVTFNGVKVRALEAEKSTKFSQIEKALANFYTINGYYPTSGTIGGSAGATLIGLNLKGVEPSDANSPGTGIEGGWADSNSYHFRYMAWPNKDGSGFGNSCGAENKCQSFHLQYYDRVKNQVITVINPR